MNNRLKSGLIKRMSSIAFCFAILFSLLPCNIAGATEVSTNNVPIIVSMGDSFSSGEGIEPFYGEDEFWIADKVRNEDWLAHRSKKSWGGMLTLPSVSGPMVQHRNTEVEASDTNWFFTAVSGATTEHISKKKQLKSYWHNLIHKGDVYLPLQIDIFDEVEKTIGKNETDYVTMTLGGNDAGFSDIIMEACINNPFTSPNKLTDMINQTWDRFKEDGGIRDNLRDVYVDIEAAAGKQAKIIVAGYPKLLDPQGSEVCFSNEDAAVINEAVTNFNIQIKKLVEECNASGMEIYFVSVEEAFEGHGAYAQDPFIREVKIGTYSQDLVDFTSWTTDDEGKTSVALASSYSMHPNENGARAYAACVQSKIDELEGVVSNSSSVNYSTEIMLSVFDINSRLYGNYTVDIIGRYYSGWFGWSWFDWFTEEYKDHFSVSNASTQSIALPPNGEYTITITDNYDEAKVYSKTIQVTNKCDNNQMKFTTDFGVLIEDGEYPITRPNDEPIRTTSDERDIVLVLDVSGSMSGTPMAETKKASVNFIDTILDEDASIGIVTYDNSATMLSDFSVNETALMTAVSSIYDGGGTNIESGLAQARSMLNTSNAKKKIIVLMSDGEPNDGKEGDDLITYADDIKDDGIIIYTLGFFESLGSHKSSAQILMEGIASDGCHYEVASADDLVFFFEDVADQINGQKYIYIRIACPVDVSVYHHGETLDSSRDALSQRTEFGTLTYEENENASANTDDRIKILRLKEGVDYDVQIIGTGRGLMDYTIGFMDEDGEYSDLREFEDIKITKTTVIDTVAKVSDETVLNIDEDGDGKYDIRYRAEENGYGEEIKSHIHIFVLIGISSAAIMLVISLILKLIRRKHR